VRREEVVGTSSLGDAVGLGGRESWAALQDGAASGAFRATLASDLEAMLVFAESGRRHASADRPRPHHFGNVIDRPARGYVGNYGGIGYDPMRSLPHKRGAGSRDMGRGRVPYAPVGERAPAAGPTPVGERTLVEDPSVEALRDVQAEVRGLRALADNLERQVRGEAVVVVPSADVGKGHEAVVCDPGVAHKLDLAGRGLAALPDLAGFSRHGVTVLDVSDNALVDVDAALAVARGLEQLVLTGNRVESLSEDVVDAMGRSLRGLYAGRNMLTALPPSATQLIQLRVLMLDGNALSRLPPLETLRNLRVLSVADNVLAELPPDLWTLVHLAQIKASGNVLTEFPLPDFRVGQPVSEHEQILMELTTVDLRDNRFQELPEALAFCILGVRHLGLEGNPVRHPPAPGTFLSDLLAMKPATFCTGVAVIDDELQGRHAGRPADSLALFSDRMFSEMTDVAVSMADDRLRALDAEPFLYDVAPLLEDVAPDDDITARVLR